MSNQSTNEPLYFAYVVDEYKAGREIKSHWTRIGAVFPHKDGKGFTLCIRSGLAVSGDVMIREPLPEENAAAQTETGGQD